MASRLIKPYFPPGVHRIITLGSSSWIGDVGDNKVLKYPKVIGEQSERLAVEARIYQALGSHPRIIAYYGLDDRGLLLEFAPMGTVKSRLQEPIALRQKITWCRQAAEAVAYIHKKNIIHCDLNTRNFLLDNDFNLKLSDFQGLHVDSHGVINNGFALENVKSYLPRRGDHSDQMSDMFALGTAFYEIIIGHEPFPDLDGLDDEEEIEKRYREGRFPAIDHVRGGCVIHKCWTLAYESCGSCVDELFAIEKLTQMDLEDEHSDMVSMMSRLAATLGDQGRLDEAASIKREILEKEKRILGDEHPNTISAMSNLAATLRDQRHLDKAVSLERQVLEKRMRILGDEHPNTISAMSNLAATLKDQGHLSEAAPILVEVVEKMKRILGDEHPNTIKALHSLAVLCDHNQDPSQMNRPAVKN